MDDVTEIDLQVQRAQLASERAAIATRELDIEEREIAALAERQQTLAGQCRVAKDEMERLNRAVDEAQHAGWRANDQKGIAARELDAFKRSFPLATSYPTSEEIAEWKRVEAEKIEAAQTADRRAAEAWNLCSQLQVQRRAAVHQFIALADPESDLRHQLASRREKLARRKPRPVAPTSGPPPATPDSMTIEFDRDGAHQIR